MLRPLWNKGIRDRWAVGGRCLTGPMTEAAHPDSGLDDLSPEALLDLLAVEDLAERTAARNKLLIAHQWAVVHPATPESGVSTWGGEALLADESLGGEGCPQVAAYAAEPLAITLGVSPDTAKRLITDALELRHRLPETWKRVATLEIPAWKGRHVATLTHTLSLEAAGWVDQHIARRLHRCGAKAVDTVVAHAIAKYDPDRHAEREQRAKKQTWDIALHTPTATEYAATSELHITGDTLVLTGLYRHLCAQAAAAGKAGDDQPLGVRKFQALASLFTGGDAASFTGGRAASEASDQSRPPRAQTVALPAPRQDRPRRRPHPHRTGRTPRPGHHRQGPRLARPVQSPRPAGHPNRRRRRRQRPRPTRPDARAGHPPRSDLPASPAVRSTHDPPRPAWAEPTLVHLPRFAPPVN